MIRRAIFGNEKQTNMVCQTLIGRFKINPLLRTSVDGHFFFKTGNAGMRNSNPRAQPGPGLRFTLHHGLAVTVTIFARDFSDLGKMPDHFKNDLLVLGFIKLEDNALGRDQMTKINHKKQSAQFGSCGAILLECLPERYKSNPPRPEA